MCPVDVGNGEMLLSMEGGKKGEGYPFLHYGKMCR